MGFLSGYGTEIGLIAALLTILYFARDIGRWLLGLFRKPPPPPPPPPPPDELTRFREHLKTERDAAYAEAALKHGAERQVLQDKIDELNRRLANPEEALAQQHAIILALEERLARRGNELGGDTLAAARKALNDKDFDTARRLWEPLSEENAPAVQAKADADFALGLIAEEQVRWPDAATHYESAARLNPTYDTLLKAGMFLWRAGRHDEALTINRKLVTLSRQDHGQQSPQTATALNNLAGTLRSLALYVQAEPLYREALEINRASLGDRHPAVATGFSNLASLLQAMGRYDQAEPLYRQALETGRAMLGDRHSAIAIRLNNLASLLQATRRYDEAEPLYREALEITRATLGDRHPDVAIDLNNLACLLLATGRSDQAEPLYREALEITRATLGDRHPDVATRLSNLAAMHEETGRSDQAEPLYREALEIDRAALGDRHPDIAIDLNNLAGLLDATDRAAEATPLYLDALSIYRTAFGDTHPDTCRIARNTLIHLRDHAPAHPDLPGLQAAFPDL